MRDARSALALLELFSAYGAVDMVHEDAIGVATMTADRTIVLSLRAETAGTVGHAVLEYPPSHKDYHRVLEHLGGLAPGQEKPVPPFLDEAREPPSVLRLVAALAERPPADERDLSGLLGVPLQQLTAPLAWYDVHEARVAIGGIEHVEYRSPTSPRATAGARVMLRVAPHPCITADEVTRSFGTDFALGIPSAHAPGSVPLYYEYTRPWGALQFGFTRVGAPCLVDVILEMHPRAAEP